MSDADLPTFTAAYLRFFTREVFERCGVPESEAEEAAEVLLRADLRGIDSHGVARLRSYVDLLQAGRINPRPNVRVVRELSAVATVDGDNGLGLVVGPRANRIAMEKAEEFGSGWVGVRNTNHFGIAGYYVLQALERDLIGFAMTNSTSVVAPLWGAEQMLGTNPIATAFPGHEEPPIVIDLATSVVPLGKFEIALRKNETVPEGWGIDAEGRSTTDPRAVVDGGAILPLGSDRDHGGHKGYCLAAMVDVLTSVLTGANWGPFAPPFMLAQSPPERQVGVGIGHCFGALRIDGFTDPDRFKHQVDDWIRTFRRTKPAPGTEGPLIPGDPEREAERERARAGIPLLPPVVADLKHVAEVTGVPFDR